MCENLQFKAGGEIWPCHRCWQCRRDRVNDWVGRCIAESKTARSTIVGTLTYGSDPHYAGVPHLNAHVLFYSDVQRWLKRIRRELPGQIRFFCAGEYGSKKGRAHWHVLLFCKGQLPEGVRYRERYLHEPWPHGWSYWDDASPEAIRYVAKYVLKDTKGEWQSLYRSSTKPLLGSEYFRQLAQLAVEQQLPPRLRYRFPGEFDRGGNPREYRMSRAAAFHYLEAYQQAWVAVYGGEEWPWSELLDEFCDRRAAKREFDPVEYFRGWELLFGERKSRWIYGLNGGVRAAELLSYWVKPPSSINAYQIASRGA